MQRLRVSEPITVALVVMLSLSPILDVFAYSPATPIKFSPAVLKSPYSPTLNEVNEGQQVVIATTITHILGEQDQDIIALIEVRDRHGVTHYLAWQSVVVLAGSQMEIGISWTPEHAGRYEIRTFGLTNDWENPQILAGVTRSEVTIKSSLCMGNAECFVGSVTNIVDGDTLDIEGKRIRLSLVNTPEGGQDGFYEAKKFTKQLCPAGSEAIVDQDDGQTEGSFGRMIAKVYCEVEGEWKMLNEELIQAQMAKIVLQFCDVSEYGQETWAKENGC